MKVLRGKSRKLQIVGTLLVAAAVFQASCGTILYPERRGQPAGRLDVGVVVLDGIGLLLFLVPGIVAFVVDFGTGAIYAGPVRVEPADLTAQRVETIIREQTGKTVSLEPGTYRATQLQNLGQFTPEAVAGLQADSNAARVRFRASGE